MYFFKTFRRGGGNLRASTRQNGQYEGGKGPTHLRIPRELRCTAIAVSDYFGHPEHLVTHHAPPCKMEYPQSEKWATAQGEKWATAKKTREIALALLHYCGFIIRDPSLAVGE